MGRVTAMTSMQEQSEEPQILDFGDPSDEAPFRYEAEEWRLKISVGHCRKSPEEDMAARL